MTDSADWAAQRTEAAAEQERRLHARKAVEHEKAHAILTEFAAVARERLPTERLVVRGYGGRGSARSDVEGWYLRLDGTIGLGTDGSFYVLTAPLSVLDRLRGVQLTPTPPPLVIGAGGKDGDSIELVAALERLLPGWRT
ncbi:hypothetical protein [Pseudactinotalea suaedae]|uniref:hypothetical protein n=1 Tax=Pseudactinotalea suaedae TaxID=1524924 RepID=UPI0012E14C7A|nr:hypothetical protein [Pseudactinotalea suaedae]